MGEPMQPSAEQYTILEAAGKLATVDQPGVDVRNGTAKIDLKLPRQGVALLVLTWKP
jgi:xylan 1,4-beta-xylosidase